MEKIDENSIHKYIFQFAPKVSAGIDHYACIGYHKGKVSVYCWGNNSSNKLGLGINVRCARSPSKVEFFDNFVVHSVCCTYYCTFVLVKNDRNDCGCSIFSFGKGLNGLLGYKKQKDVSHLMKMLEKEKKEKKFLDKINYQMNKKLFKAFNINKSSSLKNVDDLLDFEIDHISSVNSDKSNLLEKNEEKKSKKYKKKSETGYELGTEEGAVLEKSISDSDNDLNKETNEEHMQMNHGRTREKPYIDIEEKRDWFTPRPMKIIFPEFTKIKYISCGSMHTLAISTKGILYGWGCNTFGCIGNGTNKNVYEPVPIFLERDQNSDEYSKEMNTESYDYYSSLCENVPMQGEKVSTNSLVIHCSAGDKHSLACTVSGKMYSWGYGGNGRLGLGSLKSFNRPQLIYKLRNSNIIFVCAGNSHSGCIDENNRVYTWGNGRFYKLGHGNDSDILYPKLVEFFAAHKKIFMLSFGCFNSLALSIKGDVYFWGISMSRNSAAAQSPNIYKIPKQINTNFKCVDIYASTYVCFGITLVGDVVCFGNYYDFNNVHVKEAVEDEENEMHEHFFNQLLNDSENDTYKLIGGIRRYGGIKKKQYHIVDEVNTIIKKDECIRVTYIKQLRGKMYITDTLRNFYKLNKYNSEQDQLFVESPFQKKVVMNSKVKAIDGGDLFSVFLLENGKIYVCGFNKNGELGNGEMNLKKHFYTPIPLEITVNKIVKIACGNNYTLILNEEGNVYGWGKNNKSQLGIGVIKDIYEPVHIKSLRNVINIFAGYDHSACIVKSQVISQSTSYGFSDIKYGDIYIWGNAESGKVGLGMDYTQESILLPRRINFLNSIYKCSLGTSHSLFLTHNNCLYACGNAGNGRLGIGDTSAIIVSFPHKIKLNERIFVQDIIAGSTYSIILAVDGFVYICGEFLQNNVIYTKPTIYPHISNVKKIKGKLNHVFFITNDNKIFGLGNNKHFHICNDLKKNELICRPQLITYFMNDQVVDSIYTLSNATFVQLQNNDIYSWGYAQNGHLAIGMNNNLTHVKNPKKIVKSWLSYEEKELNNGHGYDNNINDGFFSNDENDPNVADEHLNERLRHNYRTHIDEITLVKRKLNTNEKYNSEFIYMPLYEEEIEKLIFDIHKIPNFINWEHIQILLKKEEYNTSVNYIKHFENDLIDLYSKHITFLLNLTSYEKTFNELFLNYQNYVLSNISTMKEALPNIMHSQSTYIFDANMPKIEEFVYILQQQPLYLIMMCLLHNYKNVKNLRKLVSINAEEKAYQEKGKEKQAKAPAVIYSQGREIKQKSNEELVYQQTVLNRSGLNNYSYEYPKDSRNSQNNRNRINNTDYDKKRNNLEREKFAYYKKSSFILCSFIYDLYSDLNNERVYTIFTIFLIKLGIEEMRNCLHINELYKTETSIFFLLIKMLFMKNEYLVNFGYAFLDMNNPNSFVHFLMNMIRETNRSSEKMMSIPHNRQSPDRKSVDGNVLAQHNQDAYANRYAEAHEQGLRELYERSRQPLPQTKEGGEAKDEKALVDELFLCNDAEENRDKDFHNFIKGKGEEDEKKKRYDALFHLLQGQEMNQEGNMYPKRQVEMDTNAFEKTERNPTINGLGANANKKKNTQEIELNFIQIFDALCKIIRNLKFPEIFKIVINNIFKYFIIYEKNFSKEKINENNIYFLNNEEISYLPFFNLILMAVLNPLLNGVQQIAARLHLPVIPVTIEKVCSRISNYIEVLYLNKHKVLHKYHLRKHFASIKNIYANTFKSFIYIIANMCSAKEDIYAKVYISLFTYHLNMEPYYVQLKLFQLCHIFNLFFRYQNYMLLSLNDPLIDIVNFLYYYKYKNCLPPINVIHLDETNNQYDQASFRDPQKENQKNSLNQTHVPGRGNRKEEFRTSVQQPPEHMNANDVFINNKHLKGRGGNQTEKKQKKKGSIRFFHFNDKKKNDKQPTVTTTPFTTTTTTATTKTTPVRNTGRNTKRQKEKANDKSNNTTTPNSNAPSEGMEKKKMNMYEMKQKKKRLLFSEKEIEFFIRSKLIYNIKLDIRFLLKIKNMNICEYTKIPMPQYICHRKSPHIENNEYLFSFIHRFKYEKENSYIIATCLKNCPFLDHCICTNSLISKLRSLETHYLSLQDQKEVNLVCLINKTINVLVSDEPYFVDFEDTIPPNLYIHKMKQNGMNTHTYENRFFNIIENSGDSSALFQIKWKNFATQIVLNMLQKKRHVNYLKALQIEEEKIADLIIKYQFKMKQNITFLRNAIVSVAKLLIEEPIFHASVRFKKKIYFVQLKEQKDSKRAQRLPCNSSTAHIYKLKTLIDSKVIQNVHDFLKDITDMLTLEITFDLNNCLRLTLVENRNSGRNVISEHSLTSKDLCTIYNSSPFILCSLFKFNKTFLCAISVFHFVHLLHNLVIDIY